MSSRESLEWRTTTRDAGNSSDLAIHNRPQPPVVIIHRVAKAQFETIRHTGLKSEVAVHRLTTPITVSGGDVLIEEPPEAGCEKFQNPLPSGD